MKLFIGPLKCIEKIEYGQIKPKAISWYGAIGISILWILIYSIGSLIPSLPLMEDFLYPMDIETASNTVAHITSSILEILFILIAANAMSLIFFNKTYLEPIKKAKSKDYIYIFLITLLYMALASALIYPFYSLVPVDENLIKTFEILSKYPVFLFITVSIAAPIIEEIFFRGFLFKGLLKKYSPKFAIIFSSLIFGVIHGNFHQFITASLLGMLIAYVYYKTDSIYLAIFMHFINNTLADFILFGDNLTYQIILSTIYLIIAAVLFIVIKKKYKFSAIKKPSFSQNKPEEYNIDLI